MDQAIDWLDRNADKTVEEITAESKDDTASEDPDAGPALNPGEVAQSLVCNVCGRQLRSHAQAEFHASKTGHVDFSESTEVLKPLTEEEKKAKLEELRRKAAEKRAGAMEVDKAEQKRNEVGNHDGHLDPINVSQPGLGDPPQNHEGDTGYKGGSPEEGANQGSRKKAQREAS